MKINYKAIIPYIGIVVLAVLLFITYNTKNNLKDDLNSEIKLRNALIDTVSTYKNKYGEVVSEKKTLQIDISTLKSINGDLTLNQKDLLARITGLKDENDLITAALIQTRISLDSIREGIVSVDTVNKNITITDSIRNKKYPDIYDLKYKFEINKIKPAVAGIKPIFKIKELQLDNKQFVSFNWGERKEGYPISFNVSNSNPYFITTNIDSYAIPELSKPDIKPNLWQKIGNGLGKTGKYALAVGLGAGTMFLIMK